MDIIPQPKKNLVFDATVFSSLMSCARFTDLRFNHNLVPLGGKSNSLEVGTLVHEGLETYYDSLIKGIKKSDAISNAILIAELVVKGCEYCTAFESKDCLNCNGGGVIKSDIDDIVCSYCNGIGKLEKPKCGHKPNRYPGLKNTPPDSTSTPRNLVGWKHAIKTLEEYFDFYRSDSWVPLFVETVKSKILYEDDNIRILWKAKLDLGVDTNNGIYPVDHKTMKQRRDTIDLNNQFIGQCLVMETRAVIINKVGFQTSLKPEDKFTRAMLSYDVDRLLEWQSEILPFYAYQYLSYVEADSWPPNFTHCENKYGFCQYKRVCESNRNMREEELRNFFIKDEDWDPTNDD